MPAAVLLPGVLRAVRSGALLPAGPAFRRYSRLAAGVTRGHAATATGTQTAMRAAHGRTRALTIKDNAAIHADAAGSAFLALCGQLIYLRFLLFCLLPCYSVVQRCLSSCWDENSTVLIVVLLVLRHPAGCCCHHFAPNVGAFVCWAVWTLFMIKHHTLRHEPLGRVRARTYAAASSLNVRTSLVRGLPCCRHCCRMRVCSCLTPVHRSGLGRPS